MPAPGSDHHQPDPRPFPPTPSRRARTVQGLALALVSATAAGMAFVLLTFLACAGQVLQQDLHAAVGNAIHRPVATHCDPLVGR